MSDNYVGNAPALIAPLAGRLIQSRSHVRTDFVTQAGNTPFDDTIPQIGEGLEYLSVANFAPLLIGSRVRLCSHLEFAMGGAGVAIGHVHRSGTADALAASMMSPVAAGDYEGYLDIEYEFIVASLAPFTYSFRAGVNGGAASIKMNGRGARLLGGVRQSWLRIDEFSP